MRTVFELIPTTGGLLLRLFALLLLLAALMTLAVALRQRRLGVLAAAQLVLALGLVTLLEDCAFRQDYLPYGRTFLPVTRFVGQLPWAVIAAAEAALAIGLAASLCSALRHAGRHPSVQSVKQAVDLLPTGVRISAADGTALLSNLKMNDVTRALTGNERTDAQTLLAKIEAVGEPQGEKRLVRLGDGTASLWVQEALELGGEVYTQLTAEDVTEQYRVTAELEAENVRLRELQSRLKAYRLRETELVTRQELLAARTAVHNQLGAALLTGKYHLEHPQDTDPEALRLLLWQINTYLLSEVEEPEMETDAYESALRLTERIGVRVELSGEPPADGPLRELLGQAITECALNCVKHAGGSLLRIEADARGFQIENNGAPPKREIVPTGGLRSLQLAAEQLGASATITGSPVFRLTVRYPEPEQ